MSTPRKWKKISRKICARRATPSLAEREEIKKAKKDFEIEAAGKRRPFYFQHLSLSPIQRSVFRISPLALWLTNFMLMRKTSETQLSSSEAMARAELYFAAHPGSPSAIRRPVLLPRSGKWVAILGNGVQEESTIGLGETVEAALQAFDAQSLALSPPHRKLRRPKSTKEMLKAIVS